VEGTNEEVAQTKIEKDINIEIGAFEETEDNPHHCYIQKCKKRRK